MRASAVVVLLPYLYVTGHGTHLRLEGLSEFYIGGMLVQSLRLRESPVNRIVTLCTEGNQIMHRIVPNPAA
jgi:hypothetical protein